MLVSRRSLIIGGASLLAAPALVKASSLMPLRGYDMDPLVIGHFRKFSDVEVQDGEPGYFSMFNFKFDGRLPTIEDRVAWLNGPHGSGMNRYLWRIVRLSELADAHRYGGPTLRLAKDGG